MAECETYTKVYTGPAALVKEMIRKPELGEKKYVVVEEDNKVFALTLLKYQQLCSRTVCTTVNQLYYHSIHRRCLLKRDIMLNRLILAQVMPNIISSLIKTKQGYVGKVIGEALYILKCIPRKELPVTTQDNETIFMSPLTRILQRRGEHRM